MSHRSLSLLVAVATIGCHSVELTDGAIAPDLSMEIAPDLSALPDLLAPPDLATIEAGPPLVLGFSIPAKVSLQAGDGDIRALITSDLDADGAVDLAAASFAGPSITVFWGDRHGGFPSNFRGVLPNDGLQAISLVAGDLSNDKLPWLYYGTRSPQFVLPVVNHGHRDLSMDPAFFSVSESPSALTVYDADCDGALDLIVTDPNKASLGYLLGKGDGTTRPADLAVAVASPILVAGVGDWNGDGMLDFCTLDSLGVNVGIATVDCKLNPHTTPANAFVPLALASADFNHDQKLDLVVAEDAAVLYFPGHGDGTFDAPVQVPTPAGTLSIAAVDFDRDGHPDIAVNGASATLGVALGRGDGTFKDFAWFGGVDQASRLIAVADFNGDHLPDVVAAGNSSDLWILLNDSH